MGDYHEFIFYLPPKQYDASAFVESVRRTLQSFNIPIESDETEDNVRAFSFSPGHQTKGWPKQIPGYIVRCDFAKDNGLKDKELDHPPVPIGAIYMWLFFKGHPEWLYPLFPILKAIHALVPKSICIYQFGEVSKNEEVDLASRRIVKINEINIWPKDLCEPIGIELIESMPGYKVEKIESGGFLIFLPPDDWDFQDHLAADAEIHLGLKPKRTPTEEAETCGMRGTDLES